jgi:hypothetical protein
VGVSLAAGLKHRGWLALMLITIGAGSIVAALVPLYDPMSVAPLLHYRARILNEVATREGLVPFDESRLSSPSIDGRPIGTMNWDWTMPTVSVLLAPEGDVRALIDNPPKGYWQPFSPSDREQLPNLARYGIHFDHYLAAIGRSGLSSEGPGSMGGAAPTASLVAAGPRY